MVVGKGSPMSRSRGLSCLWEAQVGGGDERKPVARWPWGLTLSPWGRVLQTKAHQYQITSCCLSPDRRLLATVCLGGCLKVMPGLCGSQGCSKCCVSLGGCSASMAGAAD